ncbi:hypothetical protein HMPREF1863_00239 [Aedoeadaptatus coxii]|uniref:Uncharacterized protein n=1 Tax=Aedoeadaptatus coxii TaxID=755172 RepID=A0A134AKG4_9FIRM|nr:hypothetical protein HMPREF1863_00239 [Peptoniphilus coxii]
MLFLVLLLFYFIFFFFANFLVCFFTFLLDIFLFYSKVVLVY